MHQATTDHVEPSEALLQTIADVYGIPVDDISGSESKANWPRKVFAYLLRTDLKYDFLTIGSKVGKETSRIISDNRQIEAIIKNDGPLKDAIGEIRSRGMANGVSASQSSKVIDIGRARKSRVRSPKRADTPTAVQETNREVVDTLGDAPIPVQAAVPTFSDVEVLDFLVESDGDCVGMGDEDEESDKPTSSYFLAGPNWYHENLRKFQLLTDGQVAQLSRRVIEQGDKVARNKLVEHNLRLAISNCYGFYTRAQAIAGTWGGIGLDFEDLVQEASVGLIVAAERFDFRKGYKFGTYATWWIRAKIQRAIQDLGSLIRTPVHHQESRFKLLQVVGELTLQLGRDPSFGEIADKIGWPVKKVQDYINRAIRFAGSLDRQLGDDGEGRTFLDVIPSSSLQPEQLLLLKEELELAGGKRSSIVEKLNSLGCSQREVEIFSARIGLDGTDAKTLQQIGDEKGLTRERIRQLYEKVFAQLIEKLTEEEASFLVTLEKSAKWTRTKEAGPESGLREHGAVQPSSAGDGQDIVSRVNDEVAKYYNVSVHDLLHGERYSRTLALPRHVAMYLLSTFGGMSTKEIADVSGRNYQFVYVSCRKVSELMTTSQDARRAIEHIVARLTGESQTEVKSSIDRNLPLHTDSVESAIDASPTEPATPLLSQPDSVSPVACDEQNHDDEVGMLHILGVAQEKADGLIEEVPTKQLAAPQIIHDYRDFKGERKGFPPAAKQFPITSEALKLLEFPYLHTGKFWYRGRLIRIFILNGVCCAAEVIHGEPLEFEEDDKSKIVEIAKRKEGIMHLLEVPWW